MMDKGMYTDSFPLTPRPWWVLCEEIQRSHDLRVPLLADGKRHLLCVCGSTC